jgi:hypothetical protein
MPSFAARFTASAQQAGCGWDLQLFHHPQNEAGVIGDFLRPALVSTIGGRGIMNCLVLT